MKQPLKQAKAVRLFKYFYSAKNLPLFFTNWYILPLSYLGLIKLNKGKIIKLNNGLRFKIVHFPDALGVKEVFLDNDYQLNLPENIKTVIDIGANIGAFSIYIANRYPKSHLYSYEPSTSTFKILTQNIKLNKLEAKISPFKFAVYKNNTIIKLYNPGPSGLRSIHHTRNETKSESVKTVTLEKIFSSNKISKCDLLKIDCEGAEYEILKNTPANIFKKIKRVVLEFHEMTPSQSHLQLINILKANNFKVTGSYHKIENNIGYIYAQK